MSVFVKICGITSEEDALLAVAMGANALGFIFAPSPRQVRPGLVSDIIKRLPPEILTVGVFRDESPDRVGEIVNATGLIGAQLSGSESPAMVARVMRSVRFVIKGFAAGSSVVRKADTYGADCVMLDAQFPGSGEVFDWSLSAEVPSGLRLMLAGGLDATNVAGAIAAVQPWAVDVASGVEASAGRKDPIKLREFIAVAKAAPLAKQEFLAPEGDRPYDWMQDE